MQAYQRASDEIRRQGETPIRLAKSAAGIGASAAAGLGGGQLASKALSLVNQYIPEGLAIKGLNKIDPRFGKFIEKAMGSGSSFDEIRDFIKGKAESGMDSNPEPAKESRNIVEQYSPDLHQFITDKIREGRSPLEAIGMATMPGEKKFSNIIKKMTKETNMPLSAIIESSYGSGNPINSKQAAVQKYNQHKRGGLVEQELDRFNQGYGQNQGGVPPQEMPQPGQSSAPSQGKQALMSILQNIQQKLAQ